MDNITYNMHVSGKRNSDALYRALKKAKDNKEISARSGLPHVVEWEFKNSPMDEGQIWFKITVSRPFLIWLIGAYYAQLGGRA